jgi:4-hydroxythreonine-4-phosphate dehydrogenase
MSNKPNIGITIGDFNGVGPELILKTLGNNLVFNYCTPVVYATSCILKFYTDLLGYAPLEINIVHRKEDIKAGVVNLRICSADKIEITPGTPNLQGGKVAFDALKLAVSDVKDGIIQDILTAPIDKQMCAEAGMTSNGHTHYFAEAFQSEVQMILVNDDLRVAMVTGHTALSNVAGALSVDKITDTITMLNQNLQSDFGIKKPRIAVLGVNPHGGDNGLMGKEEIDIIKPAIAQVQADGILAIGPYPPDGFFGSDNARNFDGIVGMYHDQVLIPFKQVAFKDGINFSAGLPIVRTSPDHGTAYDIAGKGQADTSSFINALYIINKVHRNRAAYFDQSSVPLSFKEHRREKFSIGVPDLR